MIYHHARLSESFSESRCIINLSGEPVSKYRQSLIAGASGMYPGLRSADHIGTPLTLFPSTGFHLWGSNTKVIYWAAVLQVPSTKWGPGKGNDEHFQGFKSQSQGRQTSKGQPIPPASMHGLEVGSAPPEILNVFIEITPSTW